MKRQMVVEVMARHDLSQRRACGLLIGITRRGFRQAPTEDRNQALRQRLRELAEEEHRNVSAHRKSFFEKLKDYFIPEESNPEGE